MPYENIGIFYILQAFVDILSLDETHSSVTIALFYDCCQAIYFIMLHCDGQFEQKLSQPPKSMK